MATQIRNLPQIITNNTVKYSFVLGFLVLLGITLNYSNALAASTEGTVLTTTPISTDISANPGTTTSTTLEVQNNSSKTVTINVSLDEFSATGTSGQARIFSPPATDPSLSWVHFSQTSFSAEPGVWESVVMTIKVPKTASLGYYYAVLFTPNTSIPTTNSVTDQLKGSNAILVLLDATTANQNNRLSVQSFTANRFSSQYLPITFSINVHNSGNTFTVPSGDVFISRTKNGATIDTLDINSGQGNVLPGTNRVFQVEWSDGFPFYQFKRVNGKIVDDKNGQPIQQLTWNFSQILKFRYGRYYARLVLVYTQNGRDIPINAVVSFWVIPWVLIGTFLIIIILLGFGLWSILKTIYRKIKRSKKTQDSKKKPESKKKSE